jgi:S1-C subfamily serine protease
VPLGKTPYAWLNSAVRSSSVLSTVDEVMPDQLREVSGKLGDLFDQSGFPQILDPLSSTPITDVPPPDAALAKSPVVTRAEPSIVKVRALAESCSKQLEGSGFVIAPDRVLTNAHVVAGSNSTTVEVDGDARAATVVLYDPRTDVAVLQVDGLGLPALRFAPDAAESGADAIVAGYPLDGPFTVRAARIRADFDLRGPDIYGNTVTREVYTVRGTVQSGNSGGPLLDAQGRVLGVVFGAAPDADDVGFVLTADEVADEVAAGAIDTTAADTGACVAD